MTISYTSPAASEIEASATTAEVVYTNGAGLTHTRSINVPRLENGSVNEESYQEILEGQLRGVENKASLGVITFVDPNATEEATPE